MFATFISILVAALTVLLSFEQGSQVNTAITTVSSLVPLLILLTQAIVWALAIVPFQKAEQNLTPRVLQLVKQDGHLKFYCGGLVLASFFALFISLNPNFLTPFVPLPWTAFWIIAIGVALDFLYFTLKRIYDYINPFSVVSFFTHAAKQSIDNDREIDLCNWIESLSEVAVKSLHRSSSSLCVHSVNEMREILRIFLDSSKSIAHVTQDKQSLSEGITDKVSYTLFYFLDRLSLIYQKALDQNIEPVCSTIVTSLGKTIVDAAKCDLSLVTYPVRYLGSFCHKAEEHKMKEIPIKGSCTLVEASKAIINGTDFTYQDLIDPFASIITQLNESAKESFLQDKNINIRLLIQPLLDLKSLFQSEKVASHRDTPAVQAAIDRVLSEWETLETVLRTMPPIPVITSDQLETSLTPPPPQSEENK